MSETQNDTLIEGNTITGAMLAVSDASLIDLTAGLAGSFLENNANRIDMKEIPLLISTIHESLSNLGKPAETVEEAPEMVLDQKTPQQIKKSITDEHLISFIDGKPYKTLKRHLSTNGMTSEVYKQKYGLPADYPMTSKNYSEQRSNLAKSLGLGTRTQKGI